MEVAAITNRITATKDHSPAVIEAADALTLLRNFVK